MKKKLSEMTLEELWQLFPIIIEQHNPNWSNWYSKEAANVAKLLDGSYDYKLNHVGSTSINGICAKPIVDILVETDKTDIQAVAKLLAENGWLIMNEMPDRVVLNKGYTENGFAERVFHLHVKKFGDNKEIVFRNYMNKHPDDAKEYERLKLSLLPKYKNNRDGYTEAKTEFCNSIYQKAGYDIKK